MPSGPPLLKLNLGTCTSETGSRGPGNPPFLVPLLPFPTPDPPSYIPSATPQLLRCPPRGRTRSALPALPRSFCPAVLSSTFSAPPRCSPHRSLFPKAPSGSPAASSRQRSPPHPLRTAVPGRGSKFPCNTPLVPFPRHLNFCSQRRRCSAALC